MKNIIKRKAIESDGARFLFNSPGEADVYCVNCHHRIGHTDNFGGVILDQGGELEYLDDGSSEYKCAFCGKLIKFWPIENVLDYD